MQHVLAFKQRDFCNFLLSWKLISIKSKREGSVPEGKKHLGQSSQNL